ncbi:hypothetical protein DINM_004607 [Dirofilaria immitis]|nr:hypothetical protein [Dirofilaria immitis]
MELLPTIRNVADELMSCSDAVSRRFQLKDETATASEKLALSIKLLTPKVAEHEEYANFLKSQSKMYDIIGNMQRTMYTEIQDKMDTALAEVQTSNIKNENETTTKSFKLEQYRKDYETQLALVKADLRKIPAIQIDQAICLKRFNELMFDYHKQMEEVLKKFGAEKV